MKVLCVLPHYHSKTSANNICMQAIIDKLVANGDKVDILCTDNKGEYDALERENECNIFSMVNVYNQAAVSCGCSWNQMRPVARNLVKAKCLVTTLFKDKTDYYAVDAISRKRIKNLIGGKYDVIISHSHPFAAHSIARDLLKMGVAPKWYAFLWDPFVYNKTDPVKYLPRRKKVACNLLKSAARVFMLEGIKRENESNGYCPAYHARAKEIVLPIMKKTKGNFTPKASIETTLTFAGNFYGDIRRPDTMLEVLSHLPKGYVVQLFGSGCRGIIGEKAALFQECKLVDFGSVEHEKCIEELMNSDILLNVGNTITNQLPSKVFEYISLGKPIINFYYSEADLGLKYFQKYPLCYHFNLSHYTCADVEELLAFCKKNKGLNIPYEQATADLKQFCAENVIDSIVGEIYGLDE